MSMDPDGTNRIIQQQIKEWHAFLEGERNARLLEPERAGLRRSLAQSGQQLLAAIARRYHLIRHRTARVAVPALPVAEEG
jgi:hypothetical protein